MSPLPVGSPHRPGRGFDQSERRLLDGATGTELGRRGVDVGPPLWSARALFDDRGRAILGAIHAEYIAAGARVITTNTFRCHCRSLAKAGLADRAAEVTALAVAIARAAAGDRILVAGSIAPLEDCYRPDLVPPDDDLAAEHAEMAVRLASAGCDLLLVETMNTIPEAVAAATQAVATGLPTLVSFVCGPDRRLLSGESLAEAARALGGLPIAGLGVNCTPAAVLGSCLAELPADLPRVAYANAGARAADGTWRETRASSPDEYARYAASWDAQLVGGCCGTTPDHIAALAGLRERGGRWFPWQDPSAGPVSRTRAR